MVREDGQWTYFCGIQPVFCHDETDRPSFRMFTAHLVCQGACKQKDIIRTFGVSKNSVGRSVDKYRQEGVVGFYRPRRGRGATVMTAEVTAQAQELLDRGWARREVADELGIKCDTLRKAIEQGRVHEPSREKTVVAPDPPSEPADPPSSQASDKSPRGDEDASAAMGIGCTRPGERVLAALGMLNGAPTRFETCRDVSFGAVLCALPALAEQGLFRHWGRSLPSVSGYYTTLQVIILLATWRFVASRRWSVFSMSLRGNWAN